MNTHNPGTTNQLQKVAVITTASLKFEGPEGIQQQPLFPN